MNGTTRLEIPVECDVKHSFRVAQIAGMFDVNITEKAREVFRIEMPPLEDDWKIGLIVGPSGSGKSTVAKTLFGDNLYEPGEWSHDAAVVDGFGEMPIKEITKLLTTVGFSSPPGWVKPYRVLSNGERFRCDLAKALSQQSGVTVFDEFTSVVDRNVAKVSSAAIAKGMKSGKIPGQFVAVTCHYDIMEWLEPDWVLDMANGTISRRSLRRPEIRLQIYRCGRDAWALFARHHYLSGNLNKSVKCYLAVWNGEPVAFCAVIPVMGFSGRRRISRIVTLPDYQGVGIGAAFLEAIAEIHRKAKLRLSITASHPAIIGHCDRSKNWKTTNLMRVGSAKQKIAWYKGSVSRCVVSFEYIGNGNKRKVREGEHHAKERRQESGQEKTGA